MPLYFLHTINESSKLAIWKIDEQEDFFLQHVPLQRTITHPHKRLQHLAGRYLLKFLFPDFPHHEILIADTRKPYLHYEQYHFSISHCGDFAAVIVSSTNRVGIDIEIPSEKVERIKHKFLGQEEDMLISQLSFPASQQLSTLLWSAKESIFKWYSLGEVDFRNHIQLQGEIILRKDEFMQLPFLFLKSEKSEIEVLSKIFEGLVLSYCIS